MIAMAKAPDRHDVVKTLAASRDARGKAKRQFADTKEYLKPQSFVNRWKVKQNALQKQVIEASHKAVRKNAPVIAIMAVSALLFAGRRSITDKIISRSKRDISTLDIWMNTPINNRKPR